MPYSKNVSRQKLKLLSQTRKSLVTTEKKQELYFEIVTGYMETRKLDTQAQFICLTKKN